MHASDRALTMLRLPTSSRRRGILRLLGAGIGAGMGMALLGGCSVLTAGAMKAPSLSFRELKIRDISRQEIRFELIVDAQNPNDIDLPITGLRFALTLADIPIAQGHAVDPQLLLPRLGNRSVTLTLNARTAELMAALRRAPAAQSPGVAYRLNGYARWGQWPVELPFEREGVIDPLRALRRWLPGGPPAVG